MSYGSTPYLKEDLDEVAVVVRPGAGHLHGVVAYNASASWVFLQVFDHAAPTVGTTKPVLVLPIPPTGAMDYVPAAAIQFSTAISIACTATATGAGAPAAPPAALSLQYSGG